MCQLFSIFVSSPQTSLRSILHQLGLNVLTREAILRAALPVLGRCHVSSNKHTHTLHKYTYTHMHTSTHLISLLVFLLPATGVSLYGGQHLWSYNSVPSSDDQKAASGYTWTDSVQTTTGLTPATARSDEEGGAVDEEVPASEAGGNGSQGEFTIAQSDSIETILDRLSLSQHLKLFQVQCPAH